MCSQKIRSYIDRERAGSASPRQRSLGGNGWKGPDISDLQLKADLRDLGDFTLEVCEHILKPRKQELMITSPGINIQGQGGFNYRHVHSNSLLSCVYYLQLPEGSGDLILEDPRCSAVFANQYEYFQRARLGMPSQRITPKENYLYLFPAWLPHLVAPNASIDERISIPLNIIWRPAAGV